MGTNYYWFPKDTPHCPNCSCFDYERIHIGKQSFGWRFSLHAVGNLNSGLAWKEKLKTGKIVDEYGFPHEPAEIIDLMYTDPRNSKKQVHSDRLKNIEEMDSFYDLIPGEFS